MRPEVVASGLQHPWALAFLPEGRFLVTERVGFLRVIEPNGTVREPVKGLPSVAVGGQGGLLDLILDADFSATGPCFFVSARLVWVEMARRWHGRHCPMT